MRDKLRALKARDIKRLVSLPSTALLLMFFISNPFWMAEYRLQDAVFQSPGIVHPDIFIAGIDEEALAMFGPFQQWGREIMAEAINILNTYEDARPAVIGVDVLFAEAGFDHAADMALVEAAKAGNVVMASSLQIGRDVSILSPELRVIGAQLPFPALLPHVRHGIVNGIEERDGVIRFAPLREVFGGERLYAFPVVVAEMYMEFWGYYFDKPFIDQHAQAYIAYTGLPGAPGDFFEMSFAEIFDPDFDPSFYYGAVILIGPYALGLMDEHLVPILHGTLMYGVEIHANVLQMILDNNFKLAAPGWAWYFVIAALIVLAMAMGEFLDIRIVLAVSAVLGVGYYFSALHIFDRGYVMPVFTPLAALAAVLVYQIIYGYIIGILEKGRLRNIFKKYVDPKLVDVLISSGTADSEAVGRKRDIAVLFVDVRGFTPMTEKFKDNPEVVVEILNEYLELTSTSVFNNGGSVDKFVGDATMALFNGFVPLDDYVFAAAKAALDMVSGAAAVNAVVKEKYGIDIGFGVGLHAGEAIVGNLGPSFRKDYTAIGDVVNTAARLESSAKHSQVLISGEVYKTLEGRVEADSIGKIALKGKEEPMEVYSLVGAKV